MRPPPRHGFISATEREKRSAHAPRMPVSRRTTISPPLYEARLGEPYQSSDERQLASRGIPLRPASRAQYLQTIARPRRRAPFRVTGRTAASASAGNSSSPRNTVSLSRMTIHSEFRRSAHAAVNTRFAEAYSGQAVLSGSRHTRRPSFRAVYGSCGQRQGRAEGRPPGWRTAVTPAELTDALAQEQRCSRIALFSMQSTNVGVPVTRPSVLRLRAEPRARMARARCSRWSTQRTPRRGPSHRLHPTARRDAAENRPRAPRVEESLLVAVFRHRVTGLVTPARCVQRFVPVEIASQIHEGRQTPQTAQLK